ncbi:hypothetical protein ACLB2K_007796 [Fragaria x ananassa]
MLCLEQNTGIILHSILPLIEKRIGHAAARDHVVVTAHLPPDIDPHSPRWYPACILDKRIFKQVNAPVPKWLIQWVGAGVEEATWEDSSEIMHRFPNFQVA